MNMKHRATAAAFLVTAALSSFPAATALAIPPGDGDDPPIRCPRGYVLVDGICEKFTPTPPPNPNPNPNPNPTPANSPQLTLNVARQSVDATTIAVTGHVTDADAPPGPLALQVRADGALVKTVTAGPALDITTTAPEATQELCVTALNAGPTGTNRTVCRTVDKVKEFIGQSIDYDTDHAQILSANPETLDRVTNTNGTTVQQSTTVSGSKSIAEKSGWKDTQKVTVKASGKIGIPFISNFTVEVAGELAFEQNGEVTTTRTFNWSQPVLVPAKSKVVATVAITKTQLQVPYKLVGHYLYHSGFTVDGHTNGTYTGINGHDLDVDLKQFDLFGNPAMAPVPQPEATLLAVS